MSEEVHSVRFGYESTYIAVGVGDTNVYLLDTKVRLDVRFHGISHISTSVFVGHKSVWCLSGS